MAMWAPGTESRDTTSSVCDKDTNEQFDSLHSSPGEPSTAAMAGLNVHAPTPPTVLRMDRETNRVDSTSPTSSHVQPHTNNVWAFDKNKSATGSTDTKGDRLWSDNQEVLGATYIHNHVNQSRLLWNHTAREEEEREEEALPSYLSYLQPRFRPSTSLSSSWMNDDSTTSTTRLTPPPITTTNHPPVSQFIQRPWSSPPFPTTSPIETPIEVKSKELAIALQEFVRQQVEQQPHRPTTPTSTCQCGPLQQRVTELEQKLQQLIASPTRSQPPTTPSSNIMDRVSTLEGRQSAFQSQLAQISKVLGIPVGKQHKNTSIKTLVQTLREEIDRKIQSGLQDLSPTTTSSSSTSSNLSYDTVLSVLSQEHEASLSKLRSYVEERFVNENRQRISLEQRLQRRFSEYEEWLQQLEHEFGSWHDQSTSVQTIQQQMNEIHPAIASLESITRSLQTHSRQFQQEWKNEKIRNQETMALMESWIDSTRHEMKTFQKEHEIEQYVSTITHQVATVTRQYVNVRLQDHQEWIETTLHQYLPSYQKNQENQKCIDNS